jgi:hypothetical protein
MKLFTGWVMSAGLVVAATAANAQMPAPYGVGRSPHAAVSDIGGRNAAMPPEVPMRAYGPRLLPPEEVYTVLRDSGFLPLGIPRRRGLVYTISVIERGGDDGRLVIDARTGRILRFMPAYRMGDNFDDALTTAYGPPGPPPVGNVGGVLRPSRAVPGVASHTPSVPIPKASPRAGKPAAEPVQQSAAVQAKPVEAQTTGSRSPRRRRGQARAADPADAGDAEGAGAGVSTLTGSAATRE